MTLCCCPNQLSLDKKHVTLTFKRKELLYDVQNNAFVEGDIMPDEAEDAKHQVFDVAESGNVDRVTRVLNTAHSECVEMLYPYTKEEIPEGQEALDDILANEIPETYTIVMELPQGFSLTTVKLLEHLIHEYLVCRALADWMSIVKPEAEAKWEKKYEALRESINRAKNNRRGTIRRKVKPF